MYRCISTVVAAPSKQSNILVIFGGNPNCYDARGESAISIDLKIIEIGAGNKVYGKDFADEFFKREIFVGN